MPYNGVNIIAVPGSIYAAPLGSQEPTSVTGAWPTGWISLGYTSAGSVFSLTPSVGSITPEEEYYPTRNVVTSIAADITFNLMEATARNWQLAMNNGILAAGTAQASGVLSDGTFWTEPASIGTELRVMVGWDSLNEGTTSGTVAGRLIMRQCFQTGTVAVSRRKGTNAADIAMKFSAEKPAGVQPFRMLTPATMAF